MEARRGAKGAHGWRGYKIHLTETCDSIAPRLITNVQTTPATIPDAQLTLPIQEELTQQDLAPETHLVDGGYMEGETIVASQQRYGVELMGPVLPDTSWQARLKDGYDQTCFEIKWQQQVAICPRGIHSTAWREENMPSGKKTIAISFSGISCQPCSARHLCTRSQKKGRKLRIRPKEAYEQLQLARARERSSEFQTQYQKRAGIESTIHQAANVKGVRRSRYLGLARTHLHHLFMAAALNLERATDWLVGERPQETYQSPFSTLLPQL